MPLAESEPKGTSLGAALRAAAALRERILSGDLPPAMRLREASLAAELGVSRNTLREALRLLDAEGLIEQQLYRGAVVRTMTVEDVRDIYRVRRALEVRAVQESVAAPESAFEALRQVSSTADAAAMREAWQEVGTAGMRFHQGIVALLGSPKIDDFFRVVLAQLRLAFFSASDQGRFQMPWIPRTRELCHLICAGQRAQAVTSLELYLAESERVVVDLVRSGKVEPSAR